MQNTPRIHRIDRHPPPLRQTTRHGCSTFAKCRLKYSVKLSENCFLIFINGALDLHRDQRPDRVTAIKSSVVVSRTKIE